MNKSPHHPPDFHQDNDLVLREAQQAHHVGDVHRVIAIARRDIVWTPSRCEIHARCCTCGCR